MFTVDSHILRLAEATIWRNQSPHALAIDPVAADEVFARHLDELAEDERTEIIRLDEVRRVVRRREPSNSARYLFDDVLRLAVPANEYAPLG